MKAKQVAAEILQARGDIAAAIVKALEDRIDADLKRAKSFKQSHSMVAVFRDGYTFWKAVCAELNAQSPSLLKDSASDIYPLTLFDRGPDLFMVCQANRCFLGFELNKQKSAT